MDYTEMTRAAPGARRADNGPAQHQLDTRAIEMAATAAVTATDTLRNLSELTRAIENHNELLRQERKDDRAHNEALHREAGVARAEGFKILAVEMAGLKNETALLNSETRQAQMTHERDEAQTRLKVMVWAFGLSVLVIAFLATTLFAMMMAFAKEMSAI